MKKKLPIGLSSLSEIINNNFLYVDKSRFVKTLAEQKYYFLSRPRRFGKTLFLDTLKQAFLGNKHLFKGLYLENNWDWSKQYPIIHLSFSGGNFSEDGQLNIAINEILNYQAKDNNITLENSSNQGKLAELIIKLSEKTNKQVVILIDEYDKPILDAIDNTPLAIKNREILKGFYGAIKDLDSYLKMVFVTGVTKFAKAGIFSNLNNLQDLTTNPHYADICGYTQHDIETQFIDYLEGVDLDELKRWYNGYNFLGDEAQKVYNPFDILLFISNHKIYKNYWFETGTPTFLIKLLQKYDYYIPQLEDMQVTDTALSSFDIDNLTIEVLLLQSGYLTIKETKISLNNNLMRYVLDYPNFEVKQSLNDSILSNLFGGKQTGALSNNTVKIINALENNNIDKIETHLKSLFASIPHDWYRNNNIQNYEGYYCSIIYTFFNAMGLNVIPEDNTNTGQIDLTLLLHDKIIILEFKMLDNDNATNALQQIKDKNYHLKYLDKNLPIFLIGIIFDKSTKNISEYQWEQVL